MPPGVSDPIYDCTYADNPVKLHVLMDGRTTETICGAEDGKLFVYNGNYFKAEPTITLTGDEVKDDAYYTVILSNCDDFLDTPFV